MMQIVAAVESSRRESKLCPQSKALYDNIEGYLAQARIGRIQAIDAEIIVRRMIDDDRSVVGIGEDFEIGDAPDLSEWSVTVTFSDGTPVMLTHHG